MSATGTSITLRRATDPWTVNWLAEGGQDVVLEAEPEWLFEGPEDAIAGVESALALFARRVGRGLLSVRFGNGVGVFRTPVGTFIVRSGKWDEAAFDSLLADLVRVAASLPFSAFAPSPLPYDRRLAEHDDTLYHAFVYLRHVCSDRAPAEARLTTAYRTVLAAPHHALATHVRSVPIETARADVPPLPADLLASGLRRAHGRGARTLLARALGGHLPARWPERFGVHTADTPENRFVFGFLDTCLGLLDRVEREARALRARERAASRILQDSFSIRQRLEPFARHPFFRDVGPMTQVPVGSSVLQRRRGYREILEHFVRLRLSSTCLPLSAHEARSLLEGRDIAKLYELWAFFKTVECVERVLGQPVHASRVPKGHWGAAPDGSLVVAWADGTRVRYQTSFTRTTRRRAYSRQVSPDIVIEAPGGALHVLDAKFKVDRKSIEEGTFLSDDLMKMHAYRDAIDGALSAWILYPGRTFQFFARDGEGDAGARGASKPGPDGVGAVPLLPEPEGAATLTRVVAWLLGRSQEPPPPREPQST